MKNWKEIYERTLKSICEANINEFDTIVEQKQPNFSVELVKNPNADENSLFSMKLDSDATNEDYRNFCEYIYTYIGEDIYDFIGFDPDSEEDYEI